ncbi:Fur family transcriptional regulator [Pseudanabaena sp. PCC 6802]|uniref:Fur family transcriptional regulator n=1 Tax=Pseudanabaena sp. PCC 6802 TaxID=118173 RepID=UPI00034526DA|nr:Fur family transcriptional regulator [Pseudanabaena sp. PCC 6802]
MKVKLTRSQEKVLHLLQQTNQAISAQGIYAELRSDRAPVGLATVYRSLEVLKLQGLIKSLTLPNGEAVYSVMPADKHHLNCLNCGISLPIESCPVHELGNQLQQAHNFKIYYHTLEFFGLCPQCQDRSQDPHLEAQVKSNDLTHDRHKCADC